MEGAEKRGRKRSARTPGAHTEGERCPEKVEDLIGAQDNRGPGQGGSEDGKGTPCEGRWSTI